MNNDGSETFGLNDLDNNHEVAAITSNRMDIDQYSLH